MAGDGRDLISLTTALGLRPHDVVSFVGAGGKTSAMVRLAWDLVNVGKGVVITTTTHLREPIITQARVILLEEDDAEILALLPGLVRRHGLVAVAAGFASEGGPQGSATVPASDPYRKLRGLAPGLVGRLAALPSIDHVLVEADGGRGRSLKAPGDHEPVIPPATTLLVPVAGLDAVGRCVDEATVHRPHLLARICGIPLGSVITAAVVAAALAHRQGGLKRCPPGARAVPLVNKADDDAGLQLAEKIGNLLLESPLISHVVAGSALGSGSSFLRLDRRSPS